MKDNLSRYTLRVDLALSDKLGYIAKYEGRTKIATRADDQNSVLFRLYEFPPQNHSAAGICYKLKQPKAPDLKRFSGMEKVHRDPKSRWTHGGE